MSWGVATWVAALVAASRVFVHISKTDCGFWKCAGSVKIARGWNDRALSDETGIVSSRAGRCLKLRPSCRRVAPTWGCERPKEDTEGKAIGSDEAVAAVAP